MIHKRSAAILFAALIYAVMASGIFVPAAATAPASGDADRVGAAIRDSVRSLGLQTEPPNSGTAPAPRMRTENRQPMPEARPLSFSENMARVMLWTGVAMLCVVMFLALRDNVWNASRSRRIERPDDEKEAAPAAAAARMEGAQMEADDLARQGSFAEAMHLLLLQSVTELRRRLDLSIAASLTSREILRTVRLNRQGHDAFADIIGRVELSYFGSHSPDKEEYEACRHSFETLTRALIPGENS